MARAMTPCAARATQAAPLLMLLARPAQAALPVKQRGVAVRAAGWQQMWVGQATVLQASWRSCDSARCRRLLHRGRGSFDGTDDSPMRGQSICLLEAAVLPAGGRRLGDLGGPCVFLRATPKLRVDGCAERGGNAGTGPEWK